MKYKYYDKGQRLIAESDSPIQFNVARFPIWKAIKPVIEEEVKVKVKAKAKVATVVTEEAIEEVAKNRAYKSKKKTEEDR